MPIEMQIWALEMAAVAQAQVDWGDEGDLLAHGGIGNVYLFHLTPSHSRDPFTCFTTSMDLPVATSLATGGRFVILSGELHPL